MWDFLPRQIESLWTLFTAPVLWALHFLACYVATAIYCEKPHLFGGSFDRLQMLVASLTALSVVMILISLMLSWRQWGFGTDEPPHDDPTPRDRLLFQGFSTLLLSGLSLVAVLFTSLPFLFLTTCIR